MSKQLKINVNASVLIGAFDNLIEKMELLDIHSYKEAKERGYEIYTDVVSQYQEGDDLNVCFDLNLVKK